jgi:hypothetical protein
VEKVFIIISCGFRHIEKRVHGLQVIHADRKKTSGEPRSYLAWKFDFYRNTLLLASGCSASV